MRTFLLFFNLGFYLFLALHISASTLLYDEETTRLASKLKCLVCHGQSVADSESDFARHIKLDIHKHLQKGMSEELILQEMKEKYGAQILLSPPLHDFSYLLWIFPALIALFLFFFLRRVL